MRPSRERGGSRPDSKHARVTQNLLGQHLDWPRRLPAAASWFRRLDPDVVTLQEAVATGDYDQVTEVLGDSCHVTHHTLREPDGSGSSIASRRPRSSPSSAGPISTAGSTTSSSAVAARDRPCG
ncbi:MAG: endonuclease/exonuclease/phosphatase family protein [Actinophytocola sp.]|uniref:endonuclease/exonuclease/phosphatase family protein n=1 Tax=Actinophytocola sp. TaxID=1872138 RepID=UPI003C71F023